MKHLVLYTTNHKNELINFAEATASRNLCAIDEICPGPQGCSIKLKWQAAVNNHFIQSLLLLLYNIAIKENPIYRHSSKLRHMAENLLNTPLHKDDLKRLKTFLRTGKELHIDGYVTFRMEEFREKLDMMLYSIIKKIHSNK
ncbi:MAG: putative sporulation protein YtxC [Firmicutes bacterium]|nr:putative sporulation protein YtxC [Bacillota bacterium]